MPALMADVASIIIPIFILIAAGYAAAKAKLIQPAGAKGLNDFVLYFCVPPLLFRTMQSVDLSLDPRGLWGAYYGGVFANWVIVALAARRVNGLGDAGGAAAAFASTFGNIGMMGLAVAYLGFGDEGVITAALIISIHTAIHWGLCTTWAEVARAGRGVDVRKLLATVLVSLVKNPILVALAAGGAWNFSGLSLPPIASSVIDLAGDAAIPAGLFALGLAVAGYSLRGALPAVATIIGLKMALMPASVFALAQYVFHLPTHDVVLLTVLAAMPSGMNPYLFAVQVDGSVRAVAGAIAIGVILSVVSVPILLAALGG